MFTLASIDGDNGTLTSNTTLTIGDQYIIYATPADITEINMYPVLIKISTKISGNMYAYSRISKGTVTANHLNCIKCASSNNGGSHSEGIRTIACAKASHAEGFGSMASAKASHAEGFNTIASGQGSHTGGLSSTARTNYSFAHGEGVQTMTMSAQAVFGKYNSTDQVANTIFMVGNGSSTAPSNAFRVAMDGTIYANGAYNDTGADYAEMFEWSDGNPENEDRISYPDLIF